VLRDVLGLRGTKYGCGIGYCAACTVLIDGRNARSCQTPAGRAIGTAITTVEGASGPVVDAVRSRPGVTACQIAYIRPNCWAGAGPLRLVRQATMIR
jgi:aerobic-type carbon monoxide dehydrogenase small subunit (CoxS/CutS family)